SLCSLDAHPFPTRRSSDLSRFPKWKLTFRNVGIGGDRSTGGNNRFKRDVLAHNATALTVDFGMNDGGYKPFAAQSFQVYMKGLRSEEHTSELQSRVDLVCR